MESVQSTCNKWPGGWRTNILISNGRNQDVMSTVSFEKYVAEMCLIIKLRSFLEKVKMFP